MAGTTGSAGNVGVLTELQSFEDSDFRAHMSIVQPARRERQ